MTAERENERGLGWGENEIGLGVGLGVGGERERESSFVQTISQISQPEGCTSSFCAPCCLMRLMRLMRRSVLIRCGIRS